MRKISDLLEAPLPTGDEGEIPLELDAIEILIHWEKSFYAEAIALQHTFRDNEVQAHAEVEGIASIIGLEIRWRAMTMWAVVVMAECAFMPVESTACDVDPLAEIHAGPNGALMHITEAVATFVSLFESDRPQVLGTPEDFTRVTFVSDGWSEVPSPGTQLHHVMGEASIHLLIDRTGGNAHTDRTEELLVLSAP